MLKELQYSHKNFDSDLASLLDRDIEINQEIDRVVVDIIADVLSRGDLALLHYTEKLDRLMVNDVADLQLSESDIRKHFENLDSELRLALQDAAKRIQQFHEKERQQSWMYSESDGTQLGQTITAMDRVGVYVPGGKAAYPSSVLMTSIPARVAGVNEIIMTVPTPEGTVNSAVIAAAHIAGVDQIFTIGGAQAIAALAYGTTAIPSVDKIVGPGNAYVAAAKKMVFGQVGIDMIAGPSEVVIICDAHANPDWVAMDLFAQAEHDELAQSIAITDSEFMLGKIRQSVAKLLPKMSRREIIEQALLSQGAVILVENLDQAADVSNRIAPEHLELMVQDDVLLCEKIRHAGAIFCGRFSAEVLGDYCAGPNHVLPTSGTARFSSPLGVYDFQKRSSIIRVSRPGAKKMAKTAATIAQAEGLTAHQQSAELRLTGSED